MCCGARLSRALSLADSAVLAAAAALPVACSSAIFPAPVMSALRSVLLSVALLCALCTASSVHAQTCGFGGLDFRCAGGKQQGRRGEGASTGVCVRLTRELLSFFLRLLQQLPWTGVAKEWPLSTVLSSTGRDHHHLHASSYLRACAAFAFCFCRLYPSLWLLLLLRRCRVCCPGD